MSKSILNAVEPSPRGIRGKRIACLGRLVLLLVSIQASCLAAQDDPRIAASAVLASNLQQQLGARLKAAIQEGGPVRAIEVCQVEAPGIAAGLSAANAPARVGRTSSKIRNPANAPNAGEMRVLENFSKALADGEPGPLSDFVTFPDGSARYMQSIATQAVCLVCHGTSLSNEIKAALAERYPNDHATGYSEGELRGAFVVNWPANY